MDNGPSSVIEKIGKVDDNPLEYDELVIAWNNLCEKSWADNTSDFQFAEIESAAIGALADTQDETRSGHIGNEISRMLSSFHFPTFLVNLDGRIAANNTSASLEFDLNIGDRIDLLPFSIDGGRSLSSMVYASLNNEESRNTDAVLKRAHGNNSDKEATIAIAASYGRVPSALVFVITTKWNMESADFLKQQFNLTDTESEILISFINGYSSQDIAKIRNRSHATIRTQFQSILSKTGAHNQTELLRITLSISNFIKDIGVIADAVNHPHRRRAQVLREGGRLIEVTLMGDPTGKPILTIAGPSVYTCNADMEQALYDAGLYVISVCTPGCGKTDPVPAGQDRLDTICQDIRALLDQLKIKRCVLLALTNNTPICYTLTKRLPDRFSHVVHMSACVPVKFSSTNSTQAPWVTGILRASSDHPAMKMMLLKGAIKAWATIGAKQFIRLQLSTNPIDIEQALIPKNLAETEYALKTAIVSGISAAVEDIALAFSDWSEDIEASPVDITVIHGAHDQLFPTADIRLFVAHFAHKATLIEVPDAGFTFVQKDPVKTIQLLKSVVDAYP